MKNFFKLQINFCNINHSQGLFIDISFLKITVWVDNFFWQGSIFSLYKSFKTNIIIFEIIYTGEIKI